MSNSEIKMTIIWDPITGDWNCHYEGPDKVHIIQIETMLKKGIEVFETLQDVTGFCDMAKITKVYQGDKEGILN